MAKQYRELEILVAKIQKQLAPDAEVLHDQKLSGRHSNVKRQIDVLVRQRIGQYEMTIVIDCKDYNKPVDTKGVEEFHGLVTDVGANKGVMVCPKGFSEAAKNTATAYQIDLYSPVDTDPHKWQVAVTVPATFEHRTAKFAFRLRMSAPLPFRMHPDKVAHETAFTEDGAQLGTLMDAALKRWNEDDYPHDLGLHSDLPVFPTETVLLDNGYGILAPVDIRVNVLVVSRTYFGHLPISQISGFLDAHTGLVISNAFEVNILDPDTVENSWLPVTHETELPVKPALHLTGIIGYFD